MAGKQAEFSVQDEGLQVQVSGDADKVQNVYQALQGVVNSMAPNVLSNGGDLTVNVKGSKDKAEE
jgi:hypothetical protein